MVCVGAELVAGDVTEELAGGLDPLAGPEAADYTVHDVEQEADNGLALVGAPADDAGDAGGGGEGWRGERGGQVFECLVARAGAAARRYRVPVGAGTTVSVTGAPAPYGVVAFEAGELGYVFGDEPGCDGVDLLGGFEPVANFKAFVVELPAGDVEVEADDGAPIVGLLAYDVRECGWLGLFGVVVLVFSVAHMFYYEGLDGGLSRGQLFTTEGTLRQAQEKAESAEEK